MPKVTIAFDADPSRIGKTEEVSEDEARVMVNEGRARRASSNSRKSSSEKQKPEK